MSARKTKRGRIEFRIRPAKRNPFGLDSDYEWSLFEIKGRPLARSVKHAQKMEAQRTVALGTTALFAFREADKDFGPKARKKGRKQTDQLPNTCF